MPSYIPPALERVVNAVQEDGTTDVKFPVFSEEWYWWVSDTHRIYKFTHIHVSDGTFVIMNTPLAPHHVQ